MAILSADAPIDDPENDLFGYAPFARQLAKSIRENESEHGLVLALYGPWGSGKTTAINFICHYLETEKLPGNDPPVVVHFNPWWFSGREDLARAFLGQLQAVLPGKNSKFKKLGSLLGDFAESIGGLLDLSGYTAGFGAKIGKLIALVFGKTPKNVPALKEQIAKILRDAKIRILIVIDDIDRLESDDVRQLLTVIKALADFPYVTYLLAYDREMVIGALHQHGVTEGDRYLEKIVQVPFELPPIEKSALRTMLFNMLDAYVHDSGDTTFDQSYWTNVFFEGLDQYFRIPRDVVRFINSIQVTFPAIKGEVNQVDFIAIEALRVFQPGLYDLIRSNPEMFTGVGEQPGIGPRSTKMADFHAGWLKELPNDRQGSTKRLIERLFPKTTPNTSYPAEWLQTWRKTLRVCHPDLFSIYFRLSLPAGHVSSREIDEFVRSIENPDEFKQLLVEAKKIRVADGTVKSRELLDRLLDYVEKDIPDGHIAPLVSVLFDIGDDLIDSADDQGFFAFGSLTYIVRPVYRVITRVPESQRYRILSDAIQTGRALATQSKFISVLVEQIEKSASASGPPFLTANEVGDLKALWVEKVTRLSQQPDFIDHPELRRFLVLWRFWEGDDGPRKWCDQNLANDEGLLKFLVACHSQTKAMTAGDSAIRRIVRLNPAWLDPFMDRKATHGRLMRLKENGLVPRWATATVSQYLKEYAMLEQGKNPDHEIDGFDD